MKRISDKLVSSVKQVSYHRNGVGGNGFHAVLFETEYTVCAACKGHGSGEWVSGIVRLARCPYCKGTTFETRTCLMIATVFDEVGSVAVLQVDKLSDPGVGVAFGENSWRGDRYEAELREAIKSTDSDGSVRVGPFAIPTKRAKAKP